MSVIGSPTIAGRCRSARGFFHCSSTAVYQPAGAHPVAETDPLVLVRLIAPGLLSPVVRRLSSELSAMPFAVMAPFASSVPAVLVRVTDPVASTAPTARSPAVCTATLPALASRSAKVRAPLEPIVTERPLAVTGPADRRLAMLMPPLALARVVVPPLFAFPSEMPLLPETLRLPPAAIGLADVTDPLVLVRLIAPAVERPLPRSSEASELSAIPFA